MKIPNYCALCDEDNEYLTEYGLGDTPDGAFNDFIQNGDFESHCANGIIAPGDYVEIYIYSVVSVEDSVWPEDERNPEWQWVLDKKVDTRIAEAI